jgi:prevent-host-death family protein
MPNIGIREFTHNAGALVRSVGAGASIVITDRGKPVADLVPHRGHSTYLAVQEQETRRMNDLLQTVGSLAAQDEFHSSDTVLSRVEW